MTSKLTHPLLAIPVSTGLLMALIAIWAVFQSDRWVINQAFLLFLPLLPLLATLYLTIYSRRAERKSHWIRLALVWVGSNALGLFVITNLFLAFHTLAPAETSPTYNYDHFGFSSYVQGHDRSVVPGGKALAGVREVGAGRSVLGGGDTELASNPPKSSGSTTALWDDASVESGRKYPITVCCSEPSGASKSVVGPGLSGRCG